MPKPFEHWSLLGAAKLRFKYSRMVQRPCTVRWWILRKWFSRNVIHHRFHDAVSSVRLQRQQNWMWWVFVFHDQSGLIQIQLGGKSKASRYIASVMWNMKYEIESRNGVKQNQDQASSIEMPETLDWKQARSKLLRQRICYVWQFLTTATTVFIIRRNSFVKKIWKSPKLFSGESGWQKDGEIQSYSLQCISSKYLKYIKFTDFREILYPRKISKPQNREIKYPQN